MITEEEIEAEGNRIVKEFGPYSKEIKVVESFYHGTYGRWWESLLVVAKNL